MRASPLETRSGRSGTGPVESSPVDSGLGRRYPVALALYAVLGVLVWFTIGEGTVLVLGRPVELRVVPLVVIGSFALRTVLAFKAEKIRRSGDEGGGSTP